MVDNYLAGNASRKEAALLQQWLDEAWREKQAPEDAEVQRLLVLDELRQAMRPKSYRMYWIGAAAASVLLLVTAGRYRYELQDWIDPVPMQTVTAFKYQVKKVMLPDSSLVVLNGGTTMKYPKFFRGPKREVDINGTAFFDVKPELQPFNIKGPHLQVKVLGTSFVVTDSAGIPTSKVSVKSGRVAVTAETVTRQLGANEELVFDQAQQQIKIYTQQEPNISWTSKKLMFNESLLSAVFGEIEKMYGVKISCAAATANTRFTGAFEETDSLDDILKIIALSYRLSIHKNGNNNILIK
ncbi:FecR family protein [Chitinophaga eiseniae]|uniref:DUF4974 domain-containing protein n=1 Tax=Chitinophaga eiseniae TaxID=634771 RepID=A0A847SR05_9BACT|nr:FecR domain-containing protein [Chitinophaga eiseniae]NLR81417.1 DUF4974 domain-containing protein [Chitinophaga eiseniae]